MTFFPWSCGHGHLQGLASSPRADDSNFDPGTPVQKPPRFVQKSLLKFVQNKK